MSNPVAARESDRSQTPRLTLRPQQIQHNALTADLNAAHARTLALTWEKAELLRRQLAMAQQFDRRLAASLQVIASLLTTQSQTMSTLEAVLQLNAAADRIVAFAQAHHRLDVIDARLVGEDGVCPAGFVGHTIEQTSDISDLRAGDTLGKSRTGPRLAMDPTLQKRQEEES